MNQIILQTVSQNINKLCLSLIVGLVPSFLFAHSSYAATLGQNLIVNGDAEQGLGDPIGNSVGTDIPFIPGWNKTGDFSVIQYGASGFNFVNGLGNLVSVTLPAVDVPGPSNRGQNLFFGGAGRGSSSAYQSIDVESLASVIDAGRAAFDLSAWLGGYANDEDIASLNITFLDATNQSLGAANISAPNAAERNNITGLFFQSTNGYVPVGTRQINVVLSANYARGRVNDSYADNVSLVITQVPEPSVSGLMLISVFWLTALTLQKKRQESQQS